MNFKSKIYRAGLKVTIILIIKILTFQEGNSQDTNTTNGLYSGNSGEHNTTIGYRAGDVVTGSGNSILGSEGGRYLSSGYNNVFAGATSGFYTGTGHQNVILGERAGFYNSSGYYNTFIGTRSGMYNSSGRYNTAVGWYSGFSNQSGQGNVFLGFQSGRYTTGSYNVFLGYKAGFNETGSGKLYIDNTDTSDPLIYGDFDNDLLSIGGRVGIKTRNIPDSVALAVNGTFMAKEVVITVDNFPDYVFDHNYPLMPLSEVAGYIERNGHLPEVPTAKQVEKEGMNVGEMEKLLLKKVEELTLYVIQLDERNRKLRTELEDIEKKY